MSPSSFTEPFDEKDEKDSNWASRTNSTVPPERPQCMQRRNSLASLSYAQEDPIQHVGEPLWPQEWRAYVTLCGGFLLMFNSWGLVNAYGTYASYYAEALLPNQDNLLLNLVGSTQSFIVLLFSVIVGRFLDAGYIRYLLITGTVLVSLGSFVLSIVSNNKYRNESRYSLIWTMQGLITGLGMACFFVSSSQVVATWFKRRKGVAIGIVASGASVAGLVYPLMFRNLRDIVGFRDAQLYVATLSTITSALAIFIARPNESHTTREPDTWLDFREFIDTNAFRNGPFMWLTAGIWFLFFGFYAVFFNLEEWAAETGLGLRAGSDGPEPRDGAIHTYLLLSIMNISSSAGRVGAAYACDHLGALNVHAMVTLFASLLVLLLWTTANTVPHAIAFVVLFGIFSGAVIGLPPASVAYILGHERAAQARLGQWTGMMYTFAAIPALTGPLIAGHLSTEFGFVTVQCWSGACLFLTSLCMGMGILRMRQAKKREEQRAREEKNVSSATSVTDMAFVRETSHTDMV